MFYSLTGKLLVKSGSTAVVECGGVGFSCGITLQTLQSLPAVGETAALYTHLSVREDAMDLFGFAEQAELEFFRLLIGVSGVGPKVALAVLSQFTPEKLALCIATGDAKTITRAQGVGPKVAQRIVMELKDKVGSFAASETLQEELAAVGVASASSNASDAVEALVALGYPQSEASLAVGRLDSSLPVEQLVRDALKALAKKL